MGKNHGKARDGRGSRLFPGLFLLICLFPSAAAPQSIPGRRVSPRKAEERIDIWYGPDQVFGIAGRPQRWVNILGNLPAFYPSEKLSFSLDRGEEKPLAIGPDGRRLLRPGDFNVEIDRALLRPGSHLLTLTAAGEDGRLSRIDLVFEIANRPAPLPFTVRWRDIASIQEAAQVVDGAWRLTEDGLRLTSGAAGYDRAVALGDWEWRDYECLVPVTFHGWANPERAASGGGKAAFGLILRWRGHTDSPVRCPQPHCGWDPVGAMLQAVSEEGGEERLQIVTRPPMRSRSTAAPPLRRGASYWLRARVETTAAGPLYRLKFWERNSLTEPKQWNVQALASPLNLARGSVLLLAHHADVAFGDISVERLDAGGWLGLIRRWGRELTAAPLLLIWLAGLFLAWKARGSRPRIARTALLALSILILGTLADAALTIWIPDLFQSRGWSSRKLDFVMLFKEGAFFLLQALAWALVLRELFGRKPSSRSSPPGGSSSA